MLEAMLVMSGEELDYVVKGHGDAPPETEAPTPGGYDVLRMGIGIDLDRLARN
tara:strand:- start:312 stop:470 length:159 start_codon:yes stop_codon:yes gene_type:complete